MPSVLIVDDSTSILKLLAHALGEAGFDVVSASNGQQALDATAQRRFDLIITDIFMPETDGIELLMQLNKRGGRPPVIALSSKSGSMDMLPSARLLGAELTLYKPFKPADLVTAAQQLLAQRPSSGSP